MAAPHRVPDQPHIELCNSILLASVAVSAGHGFQRKANVDTSARWRHAAEDRVVLGKVFQVLLLATHQGIDRGAAVAEKQLVWNPQPTIAAD
ncbi:hypothetical protein GCM10027290_04510 [Micromonospora sonneratiae]|uniref:Uncharacterized protein n=1 Tax=Micromonospora sonneratiae TaxID=1184706 RepID=A0ABW3YGB3_9ACTN